MSKKNSFYLAWSFHFLPHWIFICIKPEIHLNSHFILPIYRIINLNMLRENWSIFLFLFSFGLLIWRKKPTIFSVLYFFTQSRVTLLLLLFFHTTQWYCKIILVNQVYITSIFMQWFQDENHPRTFKWYPKRRQTPLINSGLSRSSYFITHHSIQTLTAPLLHTGIALMKDCYFSSA